MTDDPRYPPSIWAMRYSNGVVGARDRLEPYSPLSHGDPFVEYLRADVARARVAAAYEAAAQWCDDLAVFSSDHDEAETCAACADVICISMPADARAALDRLLAEARAQEREAIARMVEARFVGSVMKSGRDLECEEIAAAIRARGEAATTQEGWE